MTFKARPELPVFAEIIQAQLKAVGVRSTIKVVDDIDDALKTPTGTWRRRARWWCRAATPTCPRRVPAQQGSAQLRRLPQPPPRSGGRPGGTAPPERREPLLCEASKLATEDVAFLWLVYPTLYYGLSRQVVYEPHPNDFYFIDGTVDKKGG